MTIKQFVVLLCLTGPFTRQYDALMIPYKKDFEHFGKREKRRKWW